MKINMLRQLIIQDMNPEKHQITPLEMEYWLDLLPQVSTEMIYHMDWVASIPFNRAAGVQRIQSIQAECSTLLNALARVNNPMPGIDELKNKTNDCLDSILIKIESEFPKFLNSDSIIPELRWTKIQKEIVQERTKINKLFDKHQVSSGLRDITLKVMEDTGKLKRCSYTKLNYVREMQDGIMDILSEKNAHIPGDILTFLYSMNFNAPAFVAYYQKKITEEMSVCDCDSVRRHRLEHYEWKFKKAPFRKKKIQFDGNKRSVSAQLHDFVCAEINLLEMKRQDAEKAEKARKKAAAEQAAAEQMAAKQAAKEAMEAVSSSVAAPIQPSGYKIMSNMSVDALAYFFRLMVDASVIEAGVKTELMAFLSGAFITPNTGINGIATNSFYTKYRNPVYSTAVQTKAALNKMIKLIDKDF